MVKISPEAMATGGLKDLIFGNTINPVRHNLAVPMLIVRPGKP